MIQLTLNEINEYVKTRLDELSNNDDAALLAGDQAVEDLDKLIKSSVVPSVRLVELAAPSIAISDALALQNYTLAKWQVGRYVVVSFALPAHFLRLVSLKMSDWSRPIVTLFGEDSAEYRKQSNPYLMGTPSRPVGFIRHDPYTNVAELYSCASFDAGFSTALYLNEPSIEGSAGSEYVDAVESLRWPCLDMVTSEVLRCLGRHQEANVFVEKAADAMSVSPDVLRKNPPSGERFNASLTKDR